MGNDNDKLNKISLHNKDFSQIEKISRSLTFKEDLDIKRNLFLNSVRNPQRTLTIDKSICISSYPKYLHEFIKDFLIKNYSNNEEAIVYLTSVGNEKIFVINYILPITLGNTEYKVPILVYLPLLFPNYSPEFYIFKKENIGINRDYLNNNLINKSDLKINIDRFIHFAYTKTNIGKIINEIKKQFNKTFPIYREKKGENENEYSRKGKCILDINKAKQIIFENTKNNLENKNNNIFEINEDKKDDNNISYYNENKNNFNDNKELNKIKKELDKEKLEKKYLLEKINLLGKKNKILEEEIFTLKNELKNETEINKKLKEKIEFYKDDSIKMSKTSIDINFEKDKEIKDLKLKLSKFPFELNENENLMSIIFTTVDQKFYHSIICKNSEKFNYIENRLYEHYPDYQENENYFTVNGTKIIKSRSLEENKIHNNDIIILNTIE